MSAARAEHEYTDEELDRNWQPNARRPQSYALSLLRFKTLDTPNMKLTNTGVSRCSTIARSFSAELMDIFKIDESVTDLDDRVDKRLVTVLFLFVRSFPDQFLAQEWERPT